MRKDILIARSDFGALSKARDSRKRGVEAPITLVSPREALRCLSSSISKPTRRRRSADLKISLGGFFERRRLDFIKANVVGLTDAGAYGAAHVVYAAGGRFIRKLPGIERAFIPVRASPRPKRSPLAWPGSTRRHRGWLRRQPQRTPGPARTAFKRELIRIVDTLGSGILVFRSPHGNIVTPFSILFHWVKRVFQRDHLRACR